MTYDIAYGQLVHYLVEFSLATEYPGGHVLTGLASHRFHAESAPRPGDLIALSSALNARGGSTWALSWLEQYEVLPGGARYLLTSAKTGERCWWENVGVRYYDRETVGKNPQWRWCDRQHKFNSRWLRTCDGLEDGYLYRGQQVTFYPDSHLVELRVRRRWGSETVSDIYDDWRKVTIEMMKAEHAKLVQRFKEAA